MDKDKLKNKEKHQRRCRGFTLAETLMTVLILLMVSSVVAAGVPAAARAMNKVVDASHAQLLLSTTMTALRDELSTARAETISISNDTSISYTDTYGIKAVISSETDNIYIEKPEGSGTKRPLISDEASNKNLYVTFTKVSTIKDKESKVLTFDGLSVKYKTSGNDLSGIPSGVSFKIRVIG